MKKHSSHIVAVTSYSADVATVGIEDGFIRFDEDSEKFPFDDNEVWIGPRSHLEQMETFKQIIPYCLVIRDDKILVYERTKSGGEARLHEKVSIGLGGHVDVSDIEVKNQGQTIDLESTIANAAARELTEELKLNEVPQFIPFGLILDKSDEVGRVHLGIVMTAHVTGMVSSNEEQINLLGFKTIEELDEMNLESWSRILVNHLVKEQVTA